MTTNFTRTVTLACDAPTAFRLFTDDALWRNSKLYGGIRWDGAPWTKYSVRHVEVRHPKVHWREQRVLHVEPGAFFAILTHGMHYTTHTSMYFKRVHGTE